MQFLTDVLVGLLSGYIAFTGMLADGIMELLPDDASPVAHTEEDRSLAALDAKYEEKSAIPDILIENAAYQNAAVINGMRGETGAESVTDALVNIYCTFRTDTYERTQSGSGFFINKEGVILTNAHVAQFLLLESLTDGTTECTIRTGDPAVAQYRAELLYISPAWIREHAHMIDSERPSGTGERDYALLYVTAGLDNRPLPGRFPFLSLNTELLNVNQLDDTVTVAGYPAERFFADDAVTELEPAVADTTISDMFTFGSNYADVLALTDSPAGEHGVSGGPVIDENGEVIGMVSTKGLPEEGAGALRALTLSYVDRSMRDESTFGITETASGQLAFRAQLFMETIVPFLSRLLDAEIN